jgi:hypothetical protein
MRWRSWIEEFEEVVLKDPHPFDASSKTNTVVLITLFDLGQQVLRDAFPFAGVSQIW